MFVGPFRTPLPAYSGATFTSVQLVHYEWNCSKVLNSAKLSAGIEHQVSRGNWWRTKVSTALSSPCLTPILSPITCSHLLTASAIKSGKHGRHLECKNFNTQDNCDVETIWHSKGSPHSCVPLARNRVLSLECETLNVS